MYGKKKTNKYGNKKTIWNGVSFDSRLEEYAYRIMMDADIDFEFQVPIELVPKHRINGEAIRKASVKVDFVIKDGDSLIYMDTKGFATDVAKLKYKLLGWIKTVANENFSIVWLKNQKEVREFVNKIKTNKDE